MTDTTKKCSKCGEVKLLGEFYKKKMGKYGRSSYCSKCASIINKKWYYINISGEVLPEARRTKGIDASKRYKKENPEKVKECRKREKINLSNSYVKRCITRRSGPLYSNIPKNLIDLKREQLKLTRLIKEKQK